MNVENMKVVREALATGLLTKDGIGFNMRTEYDHIRVHNADADLEDLSGHKCQTVACIAGWTVGVLEGMATLVDPNVPVMRRAISLLALKDQEYLDLFLPFGYSNNPASFPIEKAMKVLDLCIAEGRVPERVWDKV